MDDDGDAEALRPLLLSGRGVRLPARPGWLSRLLWLWCQPLIWAGSAAPLQPQDLPRTTTAPATTASCVPPPPSPRCTCTQADPGQTGKTRVAALLADAWAAQRTRPTPSLSAALSRCVHRPNTYMRLCTEAGRGRHGGTQGAAAVVLVGRAAEAGTGLAPAAGPLSAGRSAHVAADTRRACAAWVHSRHRTVCHSSRGVALQPALLGLRVRGQPPRTHAGPHPAASTREREREIAQKEREREISTRTHAEREMHTYARTCTHMHMRTCVHMHTNAQGCVCVCV
jgi:hypothetical protein